MKPLTEAQLHLLARAKGAHPEPLGIEQREVRSAKVLMRNGLVRWSPRYRCGSGQLEIVLVAPVGAS